MSWPRIRTGGATHAPGAYMPTDQPRDLATTSTVVDGGPASSVHERRAMRIAYLNSRYPALSHTFIQREIDALRSRGVDVVPFSIRRPSVEELGAGADVTERDRTIYLLHPRVRSLVSLFVGCLSAPIRAARTIAASQRLAPAGLAARARWIAYALEAIVLARELRKRGLRDLHVHMANNGAAVALLATTYATDVRYSLTIHGPAEFGDIDRLRVRQKVHRAVFVRLISECGRAHVMAATDPVEWAKMQVIHCGIDTEVIRPSEWRMTSPLRIVAVGRLAPVKGFSVLLEALRVLTVRGIDARLRLIGDGPDRARLEQTAKRLALNDRVAFVGALAPDGVMAEIRDASVFVSSSFLEGIPVVLMEAMASGIPVIATRVGGVPEMIADGVHGRVVSPGSADAVADAIEEFVDDAAAARHRLESAREQIVEHFNVHRSAAQLHGLFVQHASRPADGP